MILIMSAHIGKKFCPHTMIRVLVACRLSQKNGVQPYRHCANVSKCLTGTAVTTYLVQNDADAPPVASAIIILASDDLGRHVLTSSNNTLRKLAPLCAVEPINDGAIGSVLLPFHMTSQRCTAIDKI